MVVYLFPTARYPILSDMITVHDTGSGIVLLTPPPPSRLPLLKRMSSILIFFCKDAVHMLTRWIIPFYFSLTLLYPSDVGFDEGNRILSVFCNLASF